MKKFTSRVLLLALLGLHQISFAQVTFWSENFSGGGVPAGWGNSDDATTNPDEIVTFQWDMDPAAVTPAALGYAYAATFNSADASNGYLWANSDRGLAAAPLVNAVTRLTTTAIDCSAQPTVFLKYDALIGVFDLDANANAIVRVSTDGMNWTDFTAFPCLIAGGAAPPCSRWSGNPEAVEIDITSVAGGQSTVYVQWQWTQGWEYFYALDNVRLDDSGTPIPANELAITSFFYPASSYSQPASMIEADTMGFFAFIKNNGSADQTGVRLVAKVKEGNTVLFADSSDLAEVLMVDSTRAIEIGSQFIPNLSEGVYTVEYSVYVPGSVDGNPDDNIGTEDFVVDVAEGWFAKEAGVTAGYRPGSGGDYRVGNLYRLSPYFTEDYGMMDVMWTCAKNSADGPLSGNQVEFFLMKVSSDLLPDWSNFDGTEFLDPMLEVVGNASYTFAADAANYDDFTTTMIDFNTAENGVFLDPGAQYFLVASYTGNSNVIFQGFNESITYLNVISTATYSSQWFLGGFGEDVAAVLRMGIKIISSTDDIALADEAMQIMPSPADRDVNVVLNLSAAQNATITMADLNGKVLDIRNIQNAQRDNVNFDVSSLPSGTYIMRVSTEEGTKTKKFVVQH